MTTYTISADGSKYKLGAPEIVIMKEGDLLIPIGVIMVDPNSPTDERPRYFASFLEDRFNLSKDLTYTSKVEARKFIEAHYR